MFDYSERFVALQRRSLESSQAIAMASVAGFERLIQLNVQAARASVEESVQKGMSLLGSRDVKLLTETLSESPQPAGDRFNGYGMHVFEIARETNAEIFAVFVKQFSESTRDAAASIEAPAKESPVGFEGMGTLFRSAVSATNANWERVNSFNRQIMDMAATNVANATHAAGSAGKRKAA
jgi:phasin family protein